MSATRRVGDFCWINMLTTEPEAACAFYAKVLGWTFGKSPMGYTIRVDGKDIGGLFDVASPGTPPGTLPLIGVMVKVDDADATAARVIALGGRARPAFDIMDAGRMSVCHDPNGAEFDLWQPKNMHGTEVNRSLHGAPLWFETMTTDVPKAAAFYDALFGWKAVPMEGPGFVYTRLELAGEGIAGMMPQPIAMQGKTPTWLVNFNVRDAHEAVRLAVEFGGEVIVPVMDIPHVGLYAGIRSPQGILFYVLEPRPS